RTAGDGVLHAEAGEDLNRSVVHRHRDMNDDFAVGISEDLPQTLVQVELLRSKIEASRLGFPGIQLLFQRYSFHLCSSGIKTNGSIDTPRASKQHKGNRNSNSRTRISGATVPGESDPLNSRYLL